MLRVTFLGTGTSQGVPVIACACDVCQSPDEKDKRLRSSVLVEDEHTTMVIDSGPDFRQQMLRAKAKKLDGLIFTHEHKDHIAGMDDIRAFNYITGRKIDIYASKSVQKALYREFHYAFDEFKYPGVPELELHTIDERPFQVNSLRIIPVEVKHYMMDVFGFRIGPFTYITDAKSIPEKEIEKIRGSEVVVLNALRRKDHVSHFTLEEALQMADKIGAGMTYLTHISHQLGKAADVAKELPAHVALAYDGLTIEFKNS